MSKVRRRLGSAITGLLLLLTVAPAATSAHADVVTPAPPSPTAFAGDAIRAMTWNTCGEAGGVRGSTAYCPFRDQPQAKANAIAAAVSGRNLNVVLLQEVCFTKASPADPTPTNPGKSEVDLVQDALGAGWTFVGAEGMRPAASGYDGKPHSYCRAGLPGTTGIAIGVKGTVNPADVASSLLPGVTGGKTEPVLCLKPVGWTTHVCDAHLSNDPGDDYQAEVTALTATVQAASPMVLGGDFNTSVPSKLSALYSSFPECDQQAFFPGDQVNQPTEDSFTSPNTVPGQGGTLYAAPGGAHQLTKIDYLFSSAGFSTCDVWSQLADHSDNYATGGPPTGFSDHAPLVGTVRGRAALAWNLADPQGSTAADASGNGHPGTLAGNAALAGGRATFAGTGTVSADRPVVETSKSLTVSAWVNLDAGAPSGAAVSVDGDRTSGFGLWYNKGDNTWRFSMQKVDADGWNPDQVIAPATGQFVPQPGTWTHLLGTFDAGTGTMSLYVNGTAAGSTARTGNWNADGSLVVGRDKNDGNPDDFWHGSIADVEVYDYPFTAAGAAALAGARPQLPTGPHTVPDSANPAGPGCTPNGGYGTVNSLTPQLTATVADADPLAAVRADFAIWDNTDPNQPQPILLGGPGSAGPFVTGAGTVQVTTPTLVHGHAYGWYSRAADGAGHVSATTAVCHFYVA
ncbi:LamG domain-containing protein [Kitasatospora sp. NPDC058965]|uniref:LamG domain-containing protein n=1 Tax=Kitasatospora sp. NPDC058965 TaxID=3346682 RepID=UPI0036C501D2